MVSIFTLCFTKAERVIAWILQFIPKCMKKLPAETLQRIQENVEELRENSDESGPLTGLEVRRAKNALIKNNQLSTLSPNYVKSMRKTLKLFQENDRIWRARGRLGHSSLDKNAKFPILSHQSLQ